MPWIRAHISLVYLHAQSQERERKKNFFHFLLIAALPDTHMVGSATGCFTGAKLWGITVAHVQRGTNKHVDVHLETHRLKTEWRFANELSFWQILPFNWLVKEAIRIQCIDAHQRVMLSTRKKWDAHQETAALTTVNYDFRWSSSTALWSVTLCACVYAFVYLCATLDCNCQNMGCDCCYLTTSFVAGVCAVTTGQRRHSVRPIVSRA